MSHHKKFKKESQDARRRDQQNVTHPDEHIGNHPNKIDNKQDKESPSQPISRK